MGKFEKETYSQARYPSSARHASPARNTSGSRSASASRKPAPKKKKKKNNLPLILGIIIALIVVVACIGGYIMFHDNGRISQNVYIAGIDVGGMTRDEALQALRKVSLDQDMNIRFYTKGDTYPLYTTTYDPATDIEVDIYGKPLEEEEGEEPSATAATEAETEDIITDEDAPVDENGVPYVLDQTLTLSADKVEITFDKEGAVEEAYKIGRDSGSKFNADRVDVDLSKYVTTNEDYIRQSLVSTLEDAVCIGTETHIENTTTTLTDRDGNPKTVDALEINLGTIKRDVEISTLFDEIIKAYTSGNFEMQYVYNEVIPEPVDITERYGLRPSFAQVEELAALLHDKETELKNGTIDLLWNGYSINASRKKKVAFSRPYLKNEQILVTKKASTIMNFNDMKGKALGVQNGSTGLTALDERPKVLKDLIRNKKPVLYDTFPDAFIDLNANRIQGILMDQVYADYYIKHQKNSSSYRTYTSKALPAEYYAVGMRKGDKTLRQKINKGLGRLQKNGELKKINQKWFGENSNYLGAE